jgi:hypothetical protein
MKTNKDKFEVLMWSLAMPGVGQFLNGKLIKGIVLLVLELIINVQGRLNLAIVHSFQGQIEEAIAITDYQWVMFYPCVYMFGIWDAYRDAGGNERPYSFLPFVFAAYLGTLGVIYSDRLNVLGMIAGPIWLPIICLVLGTSVGGVLQSLLVRTKVK